LPRFLSYSVIPRPYPQIPNLINLPHEGRKGYVKAQSRERESLAKVLVHEGGDVNHPADPGGPTNQGVTQRVYDAYRKGRGLPVRSVKHIAAEEVHDTTTGSIGTP
jgi:hypothetical protein